VTLFRLFSRKPDPPGPQAPSDSSSAPSERGLGEPLAVGVPLGGVIPRRILADPHLVVLERPQSPVAERYRRLCLRLASRPRESTGQGRAFLVTSALPGEGKTTTAFNLALAFSEDRGRETILVDADLRRPAVARHLAPEPSLGLAEVLAGSASLEQALVKLWDVRLAVLPAGRGGSNPEGSFRPESLEPLMAELRRKYRTIVLDSAPTVPFTDAAILGRLVDGVVLVVRARSTTKPLIEKALESLRDTPLAGFVLNDVRFTPVDYYYYRYDDARYDPDRTPRRRREES